MTLLVTLLTGLTAAAYVAATVLVLKRRRLPQIGSPAFNVIATAAFLADRFFPQNALAAAVASAAALLALAQILRRGGAPTAAVLAMLPLAAMLFIAVGPFFPAAAALQFQQATVAVLCAGGPVALISLLLGKSAFRTTSAR